MIRGHNGAGKSSLLKILTGLASPEKGNIYWNEQNIAQVFSYPEHMSYLGHKDGLKAALTAYENIAYGAMLADSYPALTALPPIAAAFALNAVLQVPVQQLSAGQRRKVALIKVLLQQRKIWFLDEPFASLDENSVQQLQAFFEQHLSQGGLIIMTSHSMPQRVHQIIDLSVKH